MNDKLVSFLNRSLIIAMMSTVLACSKTPDLVKLEGFTQGTTYHLTFELSNDKETVDVEKAVADELARIDAALSNYRDDSAIEQFNSQHTTEALEVSTELSGLIEEARKVYTASHGCYDLTIKPLFDLWGFKNNEFSPPDNETLRQALATVGMDKLETIDATHVRKHNPDLRVDISSIGQGYTVGQIAKVLEQVGVQNYLVEIGGELKARGKKPNGEAWRIAMEKPLPNQRKMHKIISFDSGVPLALMASGTYRHYFDSDGKRYSHILDARSGRPVKHLTVAVTVLHPDPTVADAWSTALLCLGSSEGLKVANEHTVAALFVDQDGDTLTEVKTSALDELKEVSFINP